MFLVWRNPQNKVACCSHGLDAAKLKFFNSAAVTRRLKKRDAHAERQKREPYMGSGKKNASNVNQASDFVE